MRKMLITVFAAGFLSSACGPKGNCNAQIKQINDLKAELAALKVPRSDPNEEQQRLAQARLALFKNMLAKFKSLIDTGNLKLKIKNGRMVIEMPSAVLFTSGSIKLNDKGTEMLAEVAGVLSGIEGRKFLVAGHTDNVPKKVMKYEDNWELSAARGLAVVKFLVGKGVSAEQLGAAGYGEFQTEADNDTEEGKAQNRRVEIIFVPTVNELPDMAELEMLLQ